VDISDFLALILSQLYRHSKPLTTFLVNNYGSFHRPVLIFQPTVNCRASDKQRHAVSRTALLTERTVQLLCVDINWGFWRGLGGGGGPFWLHRETVTFMGPAAYQNTVIFQVGVNKIPPNFNTLFVTSL